MFGGPLTTPAGFLPGEERWDKEFCGNENNLRKEKRTVWKGNKNGPVF